MNELTPAARYSATIMRCAEEAAAALPVSIPEDDMLRAFDTIKAAFKTAALKNSALYDCHPVSIANAIVQSALTNLYPGGPHPDVYLLPRWSKKLGSQELNWEISFRGMLKLAKRAGSDVQAVPVMMGDRFEVSRGLAPTLVHVPDLRVSRTIEGLTHIYVISTDARGRKTFEVVDIEGIKLRRAKSMSYRKGYGPWVDWPLEMATKTAIRYAIARGIVVLDAAAAHAIHTEVMADVVEAPSGPPPALLPDRGGLDDLEAMVMTEDREAVPVGSGEVPGE